MYAQRMHSLGGGFVAFCSIDSLAGKQARPLNAYFPLPTPLSHMLVVNDKLSIPLREIQFSFVRSSGPGGQNVNKVSSKAQLRWQVTKSPSLPEDVRQRFVAKYRSRINKDGELVLECQRHRDAPRNEAECLEKLRRMLADAAQRPKRRKPTRPTRRSIERRLMNKRQQSERKRRRRSLGD